MAVGVGTYFFRGDLRRETGPIMHKGMIDQCDHASKKGCMDLKRSTDRDRPDNIRLRLRPSRNRPEREYAQAD
jgi:hypothetical protein